MIVEVQTNYTSHVLFFLRSTYKVYLKYILKVHLISLRDVFTLPVSS